ncbi:hypothetical protein C2S51_038078 [Perilla frutescens var. frutescens]|nr:hypothetical protein C2S51_038078 [Perilla frutescens var. frutescens]
MDYDFQTVTAGEIRCVMREREALLRFKQGLTDDYEVLSSWENDQKECCEWKGVQCSNNTGHVTGLLLHRDDYYFSPIGGKITSSLLELHHLKHLDLSNNDFGGSRIPEFFASIENLEILNLRWSNFSGMIPPQLGNLTKLGILDLSANNVWSENLYWLSNLLSLSQLDLSGGNISDPSWLEAVLKLRSLQTLSLNGCMLVDVTPSAYLFANSSSSSLSVLDLPNNRLTSSAFNWLFNVSTSLVNIDLAYNQLDGPIPDEFGKLKFLEELDLSGNTLANEIPKSLGSSSHLKKLFLFGNILGESLEGLFGNQSCKVMTSLEEVHLSNNQIAGSIPELGACSKLRYLDLGNNKLTGEVPSSLGNLSKLEYLRFTFNSLEGLVSEAHFLKLHRLKWLHLSFNSLTIHIAPDWIPPFQLISIQIGRCKMGPYFPTWLQTQTNFSYLDISDAGISDEVPKWLWSLSPKVSLFNISHNQIRGSIPQLSSSFIEMIDVSSNKLSGPVPLLHPNTSVVLFSNNLFSGSISSICTISYTMLVLLDLSNNHLVGSIPNCWENVTGLIVLNLSNNNLSNEIPPSLGSLSNLQTLHLRGNNFSGELPSTLKNCAILRLVDIGDNKLSGNIPPWLGGSSSMTYLSIRENRFYGSIPPEICSLTEIQMLDLSRNHLSGKLPHCFDNFTSLVDKSRTTTSTVGIPVGLDGYIDYALVQWKGQEAEYRETLGLLKLVDLSSNRLVGNIPRTFSNLRGLISLNLSRNNLAGSMDSNIGEMEMLECLDVSRNQLSGEIPIGLGQLNYLAILDLANNNFSGKIPSSTQLQSFDGSVYAGNNGLCGRPLELCQEDVADPSGENDEEKDDGPVIGLSFMQGFAISMAFGFIFGFWGVVGSLFLKKSWRNAYFGFLDVIGDWMCATTTLFFTKFKR